MDSSIDRIEREALRLPERDRARLAERLLSSLDVDVEVDVEALWMEEAQRRYEELRDGKVKGRPAEEVFKRARSELR